MIQLSRWERFRLQHHEDKVLLVLTLIVGAVVGVVEAAFILPTQNLSSPLYPPGGTAAWRRVLIPVAGSEGTGFCLFRYFPNARGSGIPQTRPHCFFGNGYISLRAVNGKFTDVLAQPGQRPGPRPRRPLGAGGAGIALVLGRRLGLSATREGSGTGGRGGGTGRCFQHSHRGRCSSRWKS